MIRVVCYKLEASTRYTAVLLSTAFPRFRPCRLFPPHRSPTHDLHFQQCASHKPNSCLCWDSVHVEIDLREIINHQNLKLVCEILALFVGVGQLQKPFDLFIRLFQRCFTRFLLQELLDCSLNHFQKVRIALENELTMTKRTCERWFSKFREGERSLQDLLRSGRPQILDRQSLKAAVDASRELAIKFGCCQR